VALGIVVIVLAIGYVIGACYLTGVLGEIAQKDFTPANQRLDSYEDFFIRLERQGIAVEKSPPYIREGVKYFLWAVSLPDENRRLIYRWQHDLESNRVSPLTSPATYLDVELGYIRRQEVGLYPYRSGDELALVLAKGTYRVQPSSTEETEAAAEEEAVPEEPSGAEEVATEEGKAAAEQPAASDEGAGETGEEGGEAVDVGSEEQPEEDTGTEADGETPEEQADEDTSAAGDEETPEEPPEGDDGDGDSPPPEGEGIPIE